MSITMNAELLFALCGTTLVGMGLYVLAAIPHLLRKILAFNVVASGVFLILVGLSQAKGPGAGEPDPVAQTLVLTGIVVAFASTALALALLRRWVQASGRTALDEMPEPDKESRI
jgi:multicomponent Na+:H+ antiporter subunit C